jgi:hypothetical protein
VTGVPDATDFGAKGTYGAVEETCWNWWAGGWTARQAESVVKTTGGGGRSGIGGLKPGNEREEPLAVRLCPFM